MHNTLKALCQKAKTSNFLGLFLLADYSHPMSKKKGSSETHYLPHLLNNNMIKSMKRQLHFSYLISLDYGLHALA
jgi:hypothetical protein